ncbi:hypothetical protein HRW23_12930 [Streptomyces lunaelactis]|uniref:hypothetical protein n=1 Tax=Streptomyces lunaelactis TaxID=1535768 RepID=UPI0015850B21|nr:hypothetical protein [Streptomyces lunaelactis]NUK28434.1 hypothetical protein [Streptomyces lunaelactis]NUK38680.1 hypothetical protein [Streptomyces lunaelactis]NUK46410.1 hypothetical protein [Streptomyces lunaelactis]NUK53473.1 hypothetical protein [Streptomyces lunaelactis]NUK62420.1 hypothetical protein [Streptomyces lunaelactis]
MAVRSAERLRAAEEVVAQLRDGLGVVAVTLPSLRVDVVTLASEAASYPLVDLGRCNLDTALRLAAVLQGLRP